MVVSYAIAALAAVLSALSYAELACELPVAGGAYNFIGLIFGEATAWQALLSLKTFYSGGQYWLSLMSASILCNASGFQGLLRLITADPIM